MNKRNLLGLKLCIATVTLICAVPSLCPAQEQETAKGELKIEGGHIWYLVLRRDDGSTEKINEPNGIVELPVGEYSLLESRLMFGYRSQGIPGNIKITVKKDETALLKLGAPLTQILEVERQGRILVLNYKLRGLAGETYTDNQRSKPPGFTIYRGDKEIVSDKFSYG